MSKKPNVLHRASAALGLVTPEPSVTIPAEAELSERPVPALAPARPPGKAGSPPDRRFWPSDRPLPSAYVAVRRQQMPCQHCRRVLTDDGGQALVCTSRPDGLAFFRCKVCGKSSKYGVKVEG